MATGSKGSRKEKPIVLRRVIAVRSQERNDYWGQWNGEVKNPVSVNDRLLEVVTIVTKLLCMQLRPGVEKLKMELVTTAQQKKAYAALDGKKSIKDIARLAGYSARSLKTTLPLWESKGLVLSIGKGPGKKYVNIENLEA